MANFNEAFDITLSHEGGYSFNPNDRGGETYNGISRKFWGDWFGWEIIDGLKLDKDFPAILEDFPALDREVEKFYKNNFWDKFNGDEFTSQYIANEVFDSAVNTGKKVTFKWLQMTLNVLNRNEKNYKNLKVDGFFGNASLTILNKSLSQGNEKIIFKLLNTLQGYHYFSLMENDESQEEFARGWFSRVNFIKE